MDTRARRRPMSDTISAPRRCGIHDLGAQWPCHRRVAWDLAAIPSPKGYARISSVCSYHLELRVKEFYDACDTANFPDQDFLQIRPYNPTLRELDDDE